MAIIDIVKYEQQEGVIVYKFPSCDLRWGSQLVVYPGQVAFFVKGGKVCDQMGVPFTDTNGLVQDKRQIRKITLQVSVFKKGEGNTSGAEPYITVNAAKGE